MIYTVGNRTHVVEPKPDHCEGMLILFFLSALSTKQQDIQLDDNRRILYDISKTWRYVQMARMARMARMAIWSLG